MLPGEDLRPLFDAIVAHVPPPRGNQDAPLQLLVANLDSKQITSGASRSAAFSTAA